MSTKTLNIFSMFSDYSKKEEATLENTFEIQSLDQISENKKPVNDFRDLISNLKSVEDVMLAKAKTLDDKKSLLNTWEKLSKLINEMCLRLKHDIERSREIEEKIQKAREEAQLLQMKSNFYLSKYY